MQQLILHPGIHSTHTECKIPHFVETTNQPYTKEYLNLKATLLPLIPSLIGLIQTQEFNLTSSYVTKSKLSYLNVSFTNNMHNIVLRTITGLKTP